MKTRTGFCILLFSFLSACSSANYDYSTLSGRAALLDAVHVALSKEDCTTAITLIEPAYHSQYSSDEIRKARAAAHGCAANINLFSLITDLADNNLAGSGFWITMAKLFPSMQGDSRVVAGQYALDALLAVRKPGSLTDASNLVNTGTSNVGSLIASDRTDESNLYLLFVSMALIGSLQNRYSETDPSTYHRTRKLGYTSANPDGWEIATNVNTDGCTYAGSVLHLIDSITQVGESMPGNLGSTFGTLGSALSMALDLACDQGCQGVAGIGNYPSGCSMPAGSCNPCPTALKNRNACTAAVNDKASCAAAGIAHFINTDPLGWPL